MLAIHPQAKEEARKYGQEPHNGVELRAGIVVRKCCELLRCWRSHRSRELFWLG